MEQENQLVTAAKCGKAFVAAYTGKRTKSISILDKIFESMLELDELKDTFTFLSTDYIESASDSDSGSAYKKAISKIDSILESHQSFLNQTAVDLDLGYIPKIECTNKGKGTGPKAFKVTAIKALTTGITAVDKIPNGYIRYTIEEEAKPTLLGKLVDGFSTEGYRLHVLATAVITSLLTGFILFVGGYILLTKTTNILDFLQLGLGLTALLFGLYSITAPIYKCITLRIVECPTLLSPLSSASAQLLYMPMDVKRKSGRRNRQFKVVVHTATCPVCQSRIDVCEGKNQFRGRMIGLCEENPREHVFSFDYMTRLGKALP